MYIASTAKSSGISEITRAPFAIISRIASHSAAVTSPPTLEPRSWRAVRALPVASTVRATSLRSAPVELLLLKSSSSSSLETSHTVRTPPRRRSGRVTT
eukprot:7377775-Prymnesium_polylepis.1